MRWAGKDRHRMVRHLGLLCAEFNLHKLKGRVLMSSLYEPGQKLREVKCPSQSHTARVWLEQNSSSLGLQLSSIFSGSFFYFPYPFLLLSSFLPPPSVFTTAPLSKVYVMPNEEGKERCMNFFTCSVTGSRDDLWC